jgi:hypothetical protein
MHCLTTLGMRACRSWDTESALASVLDFQLGAAGVSSPAERRLGEGFLRSTNSLCCMQATAWVHWSLDEW